MFFPRVSSQWLKRALPADLYVRSADGLSATDTQYFTPALGQAVTQLPGVQRVQAQRQLPLLLAPDRPAVALLARELDDPARNLPLIGEPLAVPAGQIGIYVSEAMLDLHGARPGSGLTPLSASFRAPDLENHAPSATFFVAVVWRDHARQSGAIAMARRHYEQLTGDTRSNDLALRLAPGVDTSAVQQAIRTLAEHSSPGSSALLDFGSASQIRATSLRIFDRSFAVTYWLQAVLALEALEGVAWTSIGTIAGLGLGLAIAVVLVHVVNPQSFHWRMELLLPWGRLLLLCAAVVLAGTVTAWLAGRAAAGRDAVLAVKEDG